MRRAHPSAPAALLASILSLPSQFALAQDPTDLAGQARDVGKQLGRAVLDNATRQIARQQGDIRQAIASLEAATKEQQQLVRRLEAHIEATRGETVEQVTSRVASLAATQKAQAAAIASLRDTLASQTTQLIALANHMDARQDRQDRAVAEVRRDYPRYRPAEQAEVLAIDGFGHFRNHDFVEAIRVLRYAESINPSDPGVRYLLAIAFRAKADEQNARIALSSGVAAEKQSPLPAWYRRIFERIPSVDRMWIDEQRMNPLVGVRAPGVVRMPPASH